MLNFLELPQRSQKPRNFGITHYLTAQSAV